VRGCARRWSLPSRCREGYVARALTPLRFEHGWATFILRFVAFPLRILQ